MTNLERYQNIIREVFELGDAEEIDTSMTRQNTEDWTSLLHLTLVMAIEDGFGIMLETEDILTLDSYAAGWKLIEKYCQED